MPKGTKIPPQLQELVDKVVRDLEARTNRVIERKPKPPLILWHYTDARGLKGILESGTLRLGDVRKMNDSSELTHGITIGVKMTTEAGNKGHKSKEFFAQHFGSIPDYFEGQSLHGLCLTKHGDDLGQWRGYAKNGRGYAIGFDGKALVKAFMERGLKYSDSRPVRIRYDNKLLRRRYKEVIAIVMRELPFVWTKIDRDTTRWQISLFSAELMLQLATYLMIMATQHKHPAFKAEAEYRLLETNLPKKLGNRLKTLPDGRVYTEFTWAKQGQRSPLRGVIAGPSHKDKAKAMRYMQKCVKAHKDRFGSKTELKLRHSTIPYSPHR